MMSELNTIAKSRDWFQVYELAQTYHQQQQWQLAAIALQRAIELKGDFFWSWHNLGDVFSKLQQWQDAANAYSEAVKLDSQFFWSWHNLGDAFSKLEQWEQAIASYLQGIYLKPEHQSYQKLGCAFKQKDLTWTIKYYRLLIREPEPSSIFERYKTQPQRLIELAYSLTEQHQIQGAIAVYYMALEVQPTNTDLVLQLSQILQKQQQLERAIASNQQQLQNIDSSLLNQIKAHNVNQPQRRSILGKVVLQSNKAISLNQLNNLYLSVGWSSRSLNELRRAMNNSSNYVAVWQNEQNKPQLIGFARAVSDGVYQATLLDIVVHPDFQGQGIGKAVVKTITKQLKNAGVNDITLYASPHMADFYHKLGFVAQPNNLQCMLFTNSTAC